MHKAVTACGSAAAMAITGLWITTPYSLGQTLPSGAIQRIERDKEIQQQINEIEQEQRNDSEESDQPLIETSPQPVQQRGSVSIESVEVSGATHADNAERITRKANQFVGKLSSLKELEQFRHWIRQLYRDQHLLAVVSISAEALSNGTLAITITEARLGSVTVDPSSKHRLKDERAIAMVTSAVHPGSLLRLDKLTSALLKLNDLGGVKVHSKLQRGKGKGITNVMLVIEDGNRNSGFAQINNETNRYLGELETELIFTTANNFGVGEVFSIDGQWWGNAQGTGNAFGSATFTLPISSDGLKLNLYGNTSNYRLLQDIYDDNINGNTTSLKVGLKQPLLRQPKNSAWVQVDADYNTYIDRIEQVEIRNKASKVGRISLIGQHQDAVLGTGLNTMLAQFSYGDLDRSGNEFDFNLDDLTANTHGSFSKAYLLYNRYQIFSPHWHGRFLAQGQAGFTNLDGAEKISLGYPNGVRAYPPGEGAGDSGISAQTELIYRASPLVSFSAFFDAGHVWRWNAPFIGSLRPNDYSLMGTGLSINIGRNGQWMLSGTWAFPIGDNPATEDLADVDHYNPGSRLWASIKIWF